MICVNDLLDIHNHVISRLEALRRRMADLLEHTNSIIGFDNMFLNIQHQLLMIHDQY